MVEHLETTGEHTVAYVDGSQHLHDLTEKEAAGHLRWLCKTAPMEAKDGWPSTVEIAEVDTEVMTLGGAAPSFVVAEALEMAPAATV